MADKQWTVPDAAMPMRGDEPFRGLDATVSDFWSFAMSDLRTNNVRGYLAEFLVARAVGATTTRVEWDAYDILTPEGVRVEVKSAGYVQAWAQHRPSRISFSGLRGRTWTPQAGYTTTASYNADVYVFAIETAASHVTYNPLDLGQWEFYVASRQDVEGSGFASFGLSTLRRIATGPVMTDGLDAAIKQAAERH